MNNGKKLEILIVDDDPILLAATTKVVEAEGYIVRTAENGVSCLKALETELPDIILLDVVMPDINGRDLVWQIREKFKPSPIIILTSGVEISSDKQSLGLELGADGYIPRPVSNRELAARVNAFARIRIKEKELQSLKLNLEQLVENKSEELSENYKLSYNREFRIKELRDRIKVLESEKKKD